jgi:hypothetical protein
MNEMASNLAHAYTRKGYQPRPLNETVIDNGHRYSLVTRVQALTLLSRGCKVAEVEAITGMK